MSARVRHGLAIYVAVLLIFGAGIYVALDRGRRLEVGRAAPAAEAARARVAPSSGSLAPGDLGQPLTRLLLQLVVIIAFARLLGAVFRQLGQPAVVGEIVAGIALGPSVFGALAPRLSGLIFEASSLTALKLFAEIGVVLFLFVVGLELDISRLKQMAQTAVVVSHASIVVPYFLGVALSLFLYRELAPSGVSFLAFALFMGIAMSITAFPVLARILSERRLTGTRLGDTAITCAAVDDVTAWSLLAVVVAVVGARGFSAALPTIALTLAFIVAMVWLVRPLLDRLFAAERDASASTAPATTAMTGVFLFLLASALATEAIGIHALFGAFLAGAVFPRRARLREALVSRLEEVTSVLLLPLFFALTGLRTEIGLLSDGRSWLLCGSIILVATAGKLGGTLLAGRLTRMSWVDSFALGALMNTRGLMELIALNLGYELGILSPRVFAMMVLMALTTTLATGPLLSLADRLRAR
jgi:Kef-type K+ transport system membrane component KefB